MKRILLGFVTIVGAASVMYIGVTGAFFSDTETSTGNTFAAGAIDLKIDNESYYNGVASPETSWELVDLTIEKFFNFLDLKPDDYGEDTISIHVDTNDAYMCAEVTLTSNDDNGLNEPESLVDQTDGVGNGELADAINFIWWADDGDNVLETGEDVISQGPIGALTLNQPFAFALADSATNIWTGVGGPVPGDETLYIGKAWCFGGIGAAPVTQDGSGTLMSPAGNNNGNGTSGEPEDGGISCDGSTLGNETQTDSLTANVTFNAVQSRNNPNFLCEDSACKFDAEVDLLVASAKFESPEVTNGAQWDIFPSPADGWNVDWRGDVPATFGPQNRPAIANLEFHEGVLGAAADGDQYVELDSDWGGPSDAGTGEPASVSIYRTFATVPGASYTLKYSFAARPDTSAAENNLELKVEGVALNTTGPTAGAAGPIIWVEKTVNFVATDASTELRFTDLGTANSIGTFLDNVRLFQISCPDDVPDPEATTLTLIKTVINDDLGTADDSDFTLLADGPTDISGVEGNSSVTNAVVTPGSYDLSESGPLGYTASAWTCEGGVQNDSNTVTLAEGDNVTCSITNDDSEPLACEAPSLAYADSVVSSSQGVRKNGTPVLVARSNPAAGIGAPQTVGNFYDNPPPADSTFFSLGFKNGGATPGGEIVVEFTNNLIVDGPGNDLKVWEVTGGTSYPDEHIKIDVSQDGTNWFTVAADLVRDAQADIASSGLSWAKFVRITEVSPIAPFEATADGFDLDTFSALNCAVPPVQQV